MRRLAALLLLALPILPGCWPDVQLDRGSPLPPKECPARPGCVVLFDG